MAYAKKGLTLLATGGTDEDGNNFRLFGYITQDTHANVIADGYFDGAEDNGLKPGDHLLATVDLDGTGQGRHYVVTVGGANVTVVQLTNA